MIAALVSVGVAAPLAAEETVRLETLAGAPALLRRGENEAALVAHFWATWCPECVEELPHLAAAARACSDSNVRIVSVNVGESHETIVEFLETHEIAMVVLRDPHGRVWRELSGVGLPTNITWTAAGRKLDVGPRDAASWTRVLKSLGCDSAAAPPGMNDDG